MNTPGHDHSALPSLNRAHDVRAHLPWPTAGRADGLTDGSPLPQGTQPMLTGLPSLELVHQLHNLRVFLYAARAGSMARAAEQLFKAPSAITRSITELERAIGASLFQRNPRGISLTTKGEAVRERAERIQDEIALAATPFLDAGPRGTSASQHTIVTLLCNGRKLLLVTYLAGLRNISLAAARMGMTQAGASMALARMEEVLGQPLFQRRSDGMIASDGAEQLVGHARRIFAELRHVASEVGTEPGALCGNVVIGTTPLGRTERVMHIIADVIAAQPGLHVTTIEGSYQHLTELLARGEVDLAVGALRPSEQSHGLITEPLFADRLAILVGANHPLAGRTGLTLADLAGERWIMPRANALARPTIEAAFAASGLPTPEAAIETGDLAIVRHLLRTTDLLAITTPQQLRQDIAEGHLREISVGRFAFKRMVGLIRRRDAVLSPACRIFADTIRSRLRPDAVAA